VVAIAVAGCGRGAFVCAGSSECDDGLCQPNGYCSFDDPECESGQRYGALAGGGLAGVCVPPDRDASTSGVASSTSAGVTTAATTSSTTDSEAGTTSTTNTEDPPVDWWDPSWSRRQRLVLDTAGIGTSLQSVPVLVVLDDARAEMEAMDPGGDDLVFVASDDVTVLGHEIDEWDVAGRSWVWVRLPQIVPGEETFFWMYYGHGGGISPIQAPSVWDGDHAGVWHLGAQLADATDPSQSVEASSTSVAQGRIGNGRDFGEREAIVEVGSSPILDDLPVDGLTFSAWAYARSHGQNGGGRLADKADAVSPTVGFSFQLRETSDYEGLQFDRGGVGEGVWVAPPGVIPLEQWVHIAVVYRDGEAPVFFVDGVELSAEEVAPWEAPAATDAVSTLTLGNDPSLRREFDGVLDEIRISRGIRSADWIELEFRSGSDELLQFGPVELLP
jgi:biopolymer transport protein ExbB